MKIPSLWEIVKSPGVMAVIAILSFTFGIYQHYYEKKPSLLIKTEAISSVFSVLQPVGGLQISYAGQDLRNSKQSLWVITSSISNDGSAVIKKNDFDDSIPFGLSVSGGQIVEAPTITSENKYLEENLKPSLQSNRIIFSPVILEPHDSFRVRLLVLGPEGANPYITGFAKIAGLQQIEYATPDAPESKKSVWAKITEADAIWIHFVRPIVYGMGGIFGLMLLTLSIAIIVIPISEFKEWKSKKDRIKQVSSYKPNEDIRWEARILGDIYIEKGGNALINIKRIIDQAEKRCQLIKEFENINTDGKYDQIISNETTFRNYWMVEELKKASLLNFEGIKPVLTNMLKRSLEDLASHLTIDLNKEDIRDPLNKSKRNAKDNSQKNLIVSNPQ